MALQFNFFDSSQDSAKDSRTLPEGFHYQPEVLEQSEEADLVRVIGKLPFREFDFHGYLGKRRVVSFGWQYDYSGQKLRKADGIPEFLIHIREIAAAFADVEPDYLQQILVTEYVPGAGIGWHRDKAVFGDVVGISLLAPCLLRFRRRLTKPGSEQKRFTQWERANIPVERRSAYSLTGPARSSWEHSILRVDSLRYAITFRNVLESARS
jgi:alkylated DNA repair dioxygenase AlkB